MGKGTAVLGVLALLIGASGLAFGLFAWSGANNANNQINLENAWYSNGNMVIGITEISTYKTVPNLLIAINLPTNVSLYISFTCRATILINSGWASVAFYFAIDGTRLFHPFTMVGSYQGGASYEAYSVSLQHCIENLTPGAHNITVLYITESLGHSISEFRLFAASFIS